jgi:spermidine/putrescine transport system permease protein
MQDGFINIWIYRAGWAYVLGVVAMLMTPVLHIVYISFNEYGFGAQIYEFTWDWYRLILADKILVASLRWTGFLALGVMATAVPMGLLAAKFYKKTRRKVAFVTLMLSPLFVPADIMGSALLIYFKNLNKGLEAFGETLGVTWFEGWFQLGFSTALIGQIIYTVPYAFIIILITMSRYRDQQTEAARGCGATGWQAFWQVEFPQIRVGIFSSFAFVVILSFNEATRTGLLKGGFDTFPNVLVAQMLNIGMSGESYAMAGTMSMISILVIGSIIVFTLVRAGRLERKFLPKAEPVRLV